MTQKSTSDKKTPSNLLYLWLMSIFVTLATIQIFPQILQVHINNSIVKIYRYSNNSDNHQSYNGIDSSGFKEHFNVFEWIKSTNSTANISFYVNEIKLSQNKNHTCQNFAQIQHILWEIPILKLLLLIDRILTVNGFEYTFSYGTLLSVLRNDKVIPWDKDADIVLKLNITYDIDFALAVILKAIEQIPEMNKYILCQKSNFAKIRALNCHLYGYPAYLDIFVAWNISNRINDGAIRTEIMSYHRFPPSYMDWDYYNLKNVPIERNWTIRVNQKYGSNYMIPDVKKEDICYKQCVMIKHFIPYHLSSRKKWIDLLYINKAFDDYDCQKIKAFDQVK